jgi:hypothetical protein
MGGFPGSHHSRHFFSSGVEHLVGSVASGAGTSLTLRILTLLPGYVPLVKHQGLSGNRRREITISV